MKLFSKKIRTDEELLVSIANGDNNAFGELYKRYKDRLLYYFYRMLNYDKELAKDFLQDIFMKIIQNPQLFNAKMNFCTWIFSIAHNMCKNEYRRQEVRKNTIVVDNPDVLNNEDDYTQNHEPVVQLIFNELSQFEDDYKSAFLLKYREGFTVEEIAEILDLPEGTVKSRLFYLRKKLKENVCKQYPDLVNEYNL